MKMETVAGIIILAGITLIIVGVGLYGLARLNVPLGHLPGDIYVKGENGSFYFPLTTSILVSIILTIVLNVISRFLKK